MAAPEVTAWAGGSVVVNVGGWGWLPQPSTPAVVVNAGMGAVTTINTGAGVPAVVVDASGGSTIGAVQIKKKNSLDEPEGRSSSPL